MKEYGVAVLDSINELWMIEDIPVGFPPDGPDGMTPRRLVHGWAVVRAVGWDGDELVDGFQIERRISGDRKKDEPFFIPGKEVFFRYYPTKAEAAGSRLIAELNRISDLINADLKRMFEQVRLELWAIAQEGAERVESVETDPR